MHGRHHGIILGEDEGGLHCPRRNEGNTQTAEQSHAFTNPVCSCVFGDCGMCPFPGAIQTRAECNRSPRCTGRRLACCQNLGGCRGINKLYVAPERWWIVRHGGVRDRRPPSKAIQCRPRSSWGCGRPINRLPLFGDRGSRSNSSQLPCSSRCP